MPARLKGTNISPMDSEDAVTRTDEAIAVLFIIRTQLKTPHKAFHSSINYPAAHGDAPTGGHFI